MPIDFNILQPTPAAKTSVVSVPGDSGGGEGGDPFGSMMGLLGGLGGMGGGGGGEAMSPVDTFDSTGTGGGMNEIASPSLSNNNYGGNVYHSNASDTISQAGALPSTNNTTSTPYTYNNSGQPYNQAISTGLNSGSGGGFSFGNLINNNNSNNIFGQTFSGLKNAFGNNTVSMTNQAITNTMQTGQLNPISESVLPNSVVSNLQNPNMMLASNNRSTPTSISDIQSAARAQFPDNEIAQRMAVAQAAHESRLLSGHPSGLATNANNFYGMKGRGDAGSVNMKTNEFINGQNQRQTAGFAKYSSPEQSIAAYKTLMDKPRFQGVLNSPDFATAAHAVQKAGYATDPNYANKLIDVDRKIQRDFGTPKDQVSAIHSATDTASNPSATPYEVAKSYIGYGRQNHVEVLNDYFEKSMGQKVDAATTPYCAAFANSVLMNTGHGGTGSLQAKSFLDYGTATNNPARGDIAVFNDMSGNNDPARGHVGFVDRVEGNQVYTLGGNQNGQVSIKAYPMSAVAGFRTPPTSNELIQKANPMPQQMPQQMQLAQANPNQADPNVLNAKQSWSDQLGNVKGLLSKLASPKSSGGSAGGTQAQEQGQPNTYNSGVPVQPINIRYGLMGGIRG